MASVLQAFLNIGQRIDFLYRLLTQLGCTTPPFGLLPFDLFQEVTTFQFQRELVEAHL
jgi:hypothetical protein